MRSGSGSRWDRGAVSPDSEVKCASFDAGALDEDMIIFSEGGPEIGRDERGQGCFVEHDWVLRGSHGKYQGAGGSPAEVLSDDEVIVVGPSDRRHTDVVAKLAGAAGGQLKEPQGVKGANEIGRGSSGVDVAHRIAAVGRDKFAGFGEDDELGRLQGADAQSRCKKG